VGGVRRVPSRPLALALAVVALAALSAASCGDDEPPIGLADAARGTVSEVVDAPGTVTAKAAATLTAPADGRLVEMLVEPGDTVRAGDVLAVIDSPTADDRLRDAKAALAAAKRAGGSGFGGGSAGLTRVRRATDEAAE
jgi:HlyD family secretion protein